MSVTPHSPPILVKYEARPPESRSRICKRLMSPGIDSEELIPTAYIAWRPGTSNRVVLLARQAGYRFLGSLKGLQIRAHYIDRRHQRTDSPSVFMSAVSGGGNVLTPWPAGCNSSRLCNERLARGCLASVYTKQLIRKLGKVRYFVLSIVLYVGSTQTTKLSQKLPSHGTVHSSDSIQAVKSRHVAIVQVYF